MHFAVASHAVQPWNYGAALEFDVSQSLIVDVHRSEDPFTINDRETSLHQRLLGDARLSVSHYSHRITDLPRCSAVNRIGAGCLRKRRRA